MPTLFLHVGSGKTGTSALQAAFAKNAPALRRHGVVYPDSPSNKRAAEGLITSGNGVALAVSLNPHLKLRSGRTDGFTLLENALETADGRDVLYSSEFLSWFKPERLQKLVDRAQSRGYTTKLVLYVRSIAGYVYSVYNQAVKRNLESREFMQFLLVCAVRFANIPSRAEGAVPRGNIMVRNFDLVGQEVFRDFMEGVLELGADQVDTVSVPIINRSLSPFELEFARCLNGLVKNGLVKKGYQSKFIGGALINAGPGLRSRAVISQEEADLLEQRFAGSAQAINQYIAGEGIKVVDDSVEIGCRPKHEFTEFERCLMNVLAKLIPEKPTPTRN